MSVLVLLAAPDASADANFSYGKKGLQSGDQHTRDIQLGMQWELSL
jgi:hypothetical protein